MITINDGDFRRLMQFVRSRFGINLEHKRPLINARLAFDIQKRGYTDFGGYVSRILADPDGDECRHMINRLSTNYTFFFREPEYVERLCGPVLEDFLARGIRHIRVWCAACSSGEEPYSVAMALAACQKLQSTPFDFEILGTDINTELLELAQIGRYDHAALAYIPERYRPFTVHHTATSFEIAEELRRKIRWRYQNLLDTPVGQETYDIVFCRNVMIYFTPALRQEMTKKLCAALPTGGYLFTGATESIDLERAYFQYVAPTFYRKR